MAGCAEMRAVELVEADARADHGPGPELAARPGDVAARRTTPGRRRARAVGLVVAAAAVLVVLGGSVLADRREDARLRGIAGRPGIVAPLDGPVLELWRGRGWTGSDLRDVGGRLVGAVSTPYATVDVVALDPRTGTAHWRTPVGPAAVGDLWTQCVVPGAPFPAPTAWPHPVVVCVAVDETTTTEQSALGTLTYPTQARVVVVDAVDGSVLRDVPAPARSQVATLAGDVVVAHVEPVGRARVARVDPRTGAERWSFTTPGTVPTDAFRQRAVTVRAVGDVIALDAGATWVLTGDGEPVRTWPGAGPPGSGVPMALLAGGHVLARAGVAAGGGWGTQVVDLDAGTTWSAAGSPVRLRPDDGSLDDVVLLESDTSGTLRAHDRATGDVRWSLALAYSVPVAVLDGRVVAVDGDTVRAVDGRTGAALWTATLARPAQGGVVSDGRLVLVSASAATGGGVLTAVGLDDGRTRWTAGLEHAPYLFAVDGRLYGWSARGLQALGPPVAAGAPHVDVAG